jgi:quercetin dioxygenase-like cupin family protein
MMKRIAVAGIVAVALTWTAAHADSKKSGGKAVLTPVGDLKWVDAADAPGVKIAAMQGDPSKGASTFFAKLPTGFSVPLHHHSADHFGTVISGTMVFTVDGKDVTLPPGSYFAYAGKKQHITKCTDDAGCVLLITTKSKWDVVPEKPKS